MHPLVFIPVVKSLGLVRGGMSNIFAVMLYDWTFLLFIFSVSPSLPSTEQLSLLIVGVLTGVGIGAGTGYAAWKQRTTKAKVSAIEDESKARIAAFHAEEAARKGSSLEMLDEVTSQNAQFFREIETLKRDAARDKEEIERMQNLVTDFAKGVLSERGMIKVVPINGELHADPEVPPNPGGRGRADELPHDREDIPDEEMGLRESPHGQTGA